MTKRKVFRLNPPAYDNSTSFDVAESSANDLTANGGSLSHVIRRPFLKRRRQTEGVSKSCSQATRTVYIGGKFPSDTEVITSQKFPDNRVISSKYTLINFIPKNLFEQFRRVANMYFLWVAIIQLAIDSPVSPLTTSMPLAFVVTVTAIKQGYEDWLRHNADNEVNYRETTIVKNSHKEGVRAKNIKVGDIVYVQREESFPCDLVLLSSSDIEGICHVTTANLDGETNLKVRTCGSKTKDFRTADSLSSLIGTIECEQPNTDLYKFNGRINVYQSNGEKEIRPLGMESLLLRGARLKNTEYVYGCAVYTGQETKMALNSRLKSNKFSTIEKSMNKFLLFFLVILILEIVICTGLRYLYVYISELWYISYWYTLNEKDFFQTFLSFLVLFNYIIPISMYVTIEMQKFIGAMFFVWDVELFDADSNQCAKCNTSDLNEELGQVQYLFTDKTGTLTENDMQFRQCSIDGVRYQEFIGDLCLVPEAPFGNPAPVKTLTPELERFLLVLASCHTVQVNTNSVNLPNGNNVDATPEYQASSPDEKALVEACARFGVVFKGIKNDKYIIDFFGEMRHYKCLQILEFTSERRCMSVIVKDLDDNIYVLCKGAESSLLKKCVSGPVLETMKHVDDYAMLGLRTLVIAYKMLTASEYATVQTLLLDARNSLENREEKVTKACNTVEQDLILLGSVGVEDRLQDGVPETLQMLQVAGMKIWILTGDKLETAVNISYSCGHFQRCMIQLKLVGQKNAAECLQTLKEIRMKIAGEPMQNYGLVIDGSSISYALSPECIETWIEVSCSCQAVVCCRMSPIQKSEIVKAIKSYGPNKPITAAIGDGANDCSMIQEAHVGLGIMGKEGRQAMRCSDFAISRFKFLQRVFLVHGHYYYIRVSTLVQYFFYKNVAFITPQVYFAFFSAFSTQTLYDGLFMSFFNIFFTSLPIFIFGLFEQNVKQETLLEKPQLYKTISRNARLTAGQFIKWNLLGLWHSLVFFFSVYFLFGENGSLDSSGQIFGFQLFGTLIFHFAVITINIKLLLESRYLTWLFVGSVALSVFIGFMTFSLVYTSIDWSFLIRNYKMYWVYNRVLLLPSAWMTFFAVLVISLVPDLAINVLTYHYEQLKCYTKSGSYVQTSVDFDVPPPSETTPLNANANTVIS